MIEEFVNGKTKILGIIGNPVSHSLSPFIHNSISMKTDSQYIYVPFHVKSGMVNDAIKGAYALNIQGLNVTVPYKKDVMPHLCYADKQAKAAGAVNTLKYTENGYEGYNTDITGIINTFKYAGVDMEGKAAIIIGAGGSACAAAVALCEMGAKSIVIVNRTIETAKKLAKNVAKYYNTDIECISFEEMESFETMEAVKNAHAMIQTTTLGFGEQKDLSPIANKLLFDGISFVFDIIYTPWETVFIKDAKEKGCKVVNGFDMLVFQAIASYEIWSAKKFDEKFILSLKNELLFSIGYI